MREIVSYSIALIIILRRLLETVDLKKVFEALKTKDDKATSFQWRKLREACLISKQASGDILINGNRDNTDISL